MRIACSCLVLLTLIAAACGGTTEIDATEAAVSDAPAVATAVEASTDAETADDDSPDTPEPTSEPTAEPAAESGASDEGDSEAAPEDADPEPTEEPADEPADTEIPEADSAAARRLFGAKAVTDTLSADEMACALTTLAEDDELLRRTLEASDPELLSIDDRADLAVIAFDCAPAAVAAEFANQFDAGDLDVPPEVPACFIEAMGPENPERRQVILGFSALGDDLPAPPETHESIVDTMVVCFPGTLIADSVAAEALGDPAIGDALDAECLGSAFDGDAMRPIWQLLVENPQLDFDSLDPGAVEPLYRGVLDCISISTIVAAELAPLGVELSAESLACLDDISAGMDISSLSDETAGAELGALMITCLSPEELAALAGG